MRHDYRVWAALLAVILFTAVIRIRLLDVPLERDEGEYAYAGQLMLQGVAPYAEAYNMKMPGIYASYALILAVFGQTQRGIHTGLLIINAATVLVLFLLTKKLFGSGVGAAAAAAFALLSLGQWVHGIFANAEHFVILPALCGILLLLYTVESKKWFSLLAGALLLGLAFLMKQHGAAFIVFAGLYLIFSEFRRRPFAWKFFGIRVILFLVGVLLPFALTCLVLWWSGVFEKFWFWTFKYAWEYVSTLPLSKGLYSLKMAMIQIIGSATLLWVLAGIGLTFMWWHKKTRSHRLFVAGFLLFSFIAICPGFYFRPHYFILFLPAVAMLAGIGAGCVQSLFAQSKTRLVTRLIPILSALAILFHTAYQQWDFFFVMSPTKASLTTYCYHPFPESIEIARFIKEHSNKDDRIAVIGSEPQICFYSNRRSATGYIYTYALMEPHPYALQLQKEMIQEVESACPEFLVFVNCSTSWQAQPNSEKLIFEWFQQYQLKHYRRVGIIDVIRPGKTVYRWGEKALGYSPQSIHSLYVLQRKDRKADNERLDIKPDDADAPNLDFQFNNELL
jgi:hypothetical protein